MWERVHYTGKRLAQHMEFWQRHTARAVPLVLATDATRSLPGYEEAMHCGEIERALSDRMTLYCLKTGVTRLALFGALQAILEADGAQVLSVAGDPREQRSAAR